MDCARVAVGAEGIDVRIGHRDFGDFFTGEAGRQPPLPELMFAFDFAFGLGWGGVAEADVAELEGPAQLGERVGIVGKEEAVVIDVELQRPAMRQKGRRQEVEAGEQQFALVKLGAGEEAAAVSEQVAHGKAVR